MCNVPHRQQTNIELTRVKTLFCPEKCSLFLKTRLNKVAVRCSGGNQPSVTPRESETVCARCCSLCQLKPSVPSGSSAPSLLAPPLPWKECDAVNHVYGSRSTRRRTWARLQLRLEEIPAAFERVCLSRTAHAQYCVSRHSKASLPTLTPRLLFIKPVRVLDWCVKEQL